MSTVNRFQVPSLSVGFPTIQIATAAGLERMDRLPPYETVFRRATKWNIMLLQEWMPPNSVGKRQFQLLQLFAQHDYRVTLVNTRYQSDVGVSWRSDSLAYTHDIHSIPTFLRIEMFAPYIINLVRTRSIKVVILSESEMGYALLPLLADALPDVRFIGTIWKEGEYTSSFRVSRLNWIARLSHMGQRPEAISCWAIIEIPLDDSSSKYSVSTPLFYT